MNGLSALFDTEGMMPHGYCLVWDPALISLHVVSDTLIGLSYYSIPLGLGFLIARRRDLAFGWMFALFAVFILACGTTHFFETWTLWHPDYGIQGIIKAVTAAASVITAVILWPILPRVLALPSPAHLRQVNESLSREIAERSKAVEALARQKEFNELLISSTSEGIMTLDRDLVVRVWNPATEQLIGLPSDRILGRPLFEALPSLHTPVFESVLRDVLAGGERSFEEAHFTIAETGKSGWQDVRFSPFRDRHGEVLGVIALIRDVTRRHAAEEALRHAQKMEAIGQLTGGIAHDFNNFMTAVIGNLDLMRTRYPDAPPGLIQLRDSALQGALRSASLTRQLLAFSRRQMLEPDVIDVNLLVSGMSGLIERTLGESVVFETAPASDLWKSFADANQLESALLNLALNARDAMPGGGRLRIDTANVVLDTVEASRLDAIEPGEYVRVRISDTGMGMSTDTLERAFDPFFTTKEVGQGSGLGLSQVYGFVRQSGGHVEIESQVGHGTTVTLFLPRHMTPAASAERPQPAAEGSLLARPGERILVVEDEPMVRHFTVEVLEALGYEVLSAGNPDDAMRHVEGEQPIALMLSDLGLPGMSGHELAERALKRRPALKLLFVTGYQVDPTTAASRRNGTTIVNKPYDAQTLVRSIRTALDSPEPPAPPVL